MKTIIHYLIEDTGAQDKALPVALGLIGEPDFNRLELFGFEVDMDGRVLVPELAPRHDSATNEKAA